MARNRMLNPNFFLDEELATLTPHARLLYAGLWGICDDNYATLPNRPEWIRAQIFPYERIKIENLLNELRSVGKIVLFKSEDKEYWYVKNFLRYQKVDHPSKAQYPKFSKENMVISEPSPSPREDSANTRPELKELTELEIRAPRNAEETSPIPNSYLSKFSRPTKVHGPIQALATEIYEATGKREKFPALCGIIKRKGVNFAREQWQDVSKSPGRDKLSLFKYRMAQTKVELVPKP